MNEYENNILKSNSSLSKIVKSKDKSQLLSISKRNINRNEEDNFHSQLTKLKSDINKNSPYLGSKKNNVNQARPR